MKSHRCYINLEGLNKTQTDQRKIWRTDNVITHCCSFEPSMFIWEKATKFNGYDPYHGYINPKHIELIH